MKPCYHHVSTHCLQFFKTVSASASDTLFLNDIPFKYIHYSFQRGSVGNNTMPCGVTITCLLLLLQGQTSKSMITGYHFILWKAFFLRVHKALCCRPAGLSGFLALKSNILTGLGENKQDPLEIKQSVLNQIKALVPCQWVLWVNQKSTHTVLEWLKTCNKNLYESGTTFSA